MSPRISSARSAGRNPSTTINGAVGGMARSLLLEPVDDILFLPVEDQLQAVSVGIIEIDAVIIARAAAHRDAVPFEFGLERLVGAARDIERQMVEVAARRRPRAILFEQRHALMAGVHEHLPVRIP